MIRPGIFILEWHNWQNRRLDCSGHVWEHVGLGFWRMVKTFPKSLPLQRQLNAFYSYPVQPKSQCGWLFRWGSVWVGAHYSPYNRRWCINPLPFVTFWVTLKGGKTP